MKKVLTLLITVAVISGLASCSVVRYGNNADVYGFNGSTEFFGREETLPEEYKNAAATI